MKGAAANGVCEFCEWTKLRDPFLSLRIKRNSAFVKYLRPAASGCINAGCAAVDVALGVDLGLLTTII